MLKNPALNLVKRCLPSLEVYCRVVGTRSTGELRNVARLKRWERISVRPAAIVCWAVVGAMVPSWVSATHEADHRFAVDGYVCGVDGKGVAGIDVLVKDTKIAYGQVVKTDSDGYYKAIFHLHNDNLGDPILVEARGEQQNHRVQFDPKDLESERKIRVNFGTGCEASDSPPWLWMGMGVIVAGAGALLGLKVVRSGRKPERTKEKSQGKRKS
ncbi:conserved protein of unknown function [Candidatus Nitrospira inopinata]|uniref:Carboxypeptidase regulatory-like domain-containing protein n=2 Tax=Candidatus Nitrospira inopinata TaxID=1715989 RepID=A0A0S4KY29_9BACT|nr:conserved protein of unknown function [Candidatus Nitrospira inopinata]